MENRQYNGQSFYSECLNLEATYKNENIQEEDFVDFYIFLEKEFRGKKILSFHLKFSYILEYINSYRYSYRGNEIPYYEKIIHKELLECLNDNDKSMEDCYVIFLEYLCVGRKFRFSINKFSDMNFGVMATFDKEFNLKEKLIIEPGINQSYHYQIIEK